MIELKLDSEKLFYYRYYDRVHWLGRKSCSFPFCHHCQNSSKFFRKTLSIAIFCRSNTLCSVYVLLLSDGRFVSPRQVGFNIPTFKTASSYMGLVLLFCYDVCIFSHLFIAINRLCAISFPIKYSDLFSEQNTRILIFIAYAIPCFTSIYMHLANHCLLPYVDFGWYFGVNTSASCDVIRFYVDFCKDFGVVALIAIVDVSTMIMIKVTASRMNSTSSNSLQSQKHRDREIAFVKQCIIQGGVFAAELISFFIISGMQTNPVGIFICTTVAWCSVHSIDPYVLIFLNSELRNMLKKNPIGMVRHTRVTNSAQPANQESKFD
ncbi:Protein CBG01386 [Caenorhabditis briggsae]|uniref:Protein CBG01386 n=1 Tax=Caenorhabditis briggsae TaxID=6238 RepID=A8WQA5_CAEBR|nr:Protein CBG01386 [Caenorhabditis briggsae]CAP22663.1 Protein CBG01386 [Caenorhabditis briggsae]